MSRFGILGPLEVLADGRPVPLGGPQQRGLLALLLLDANRVVSRERLIGDLWGEDPPATARTLLHGCVAQLRRVLPAGRLVTRAPGYLLRVGPGELDADRFEALAGAAPPEDPAAAAERLREALALCRGPALYDLPLEACRTAAVRLDERRLAVLERRVDLELRLARYPELAAELTGLVKAEPLRERLWAQLMVALAGAGRQAEALAAFRALRGILVEQLGIEPSGLPRRVELAVLGGGDAAAAYWSSVGEPAPVPVPVAVPAQLPAGIPAFTGRAADLARLDALAAGAGPAVVVVAGTAGIGKTALAVHWAHQARSRYPDGQLYVNLRGHAPTPPVRPVEALAGFLPALGVPAGQVPMDPDRAADLYRTLLADRQVLVVLDDAGSAEQVRPLLPAGPGCAVIVTSRYGLGGLVARDGAGHLGLDVLPAGESAALLRRMLGARAGVDPAALAELARLCGHLPLALRIAAANLALQPGRTVAGQVAELAADDRLGRLAVDGDPQAAVRAAFDLSYAALPVVAARLFRRLGLVPGPDFGGPAAAALLGEPAGAPLALLADANLLTRRAPGRYALHDLLRLYAAERAAADESPAERAAATGRLQDWCLAGADAAARTLYPDRPRLPVPAGGGAGFGTDAEALAWLDTERGGLVAAAVDGPGPVGWLLADSLRGYFWRRMCTVEWLAVAEAGLSAAESAADPAGAAAAGLCLADLHRQQGRYEIAIEHYTRAAAQARAAGWDGGEGVLLTNLGIAYLWLGRLPEAADHWRQGLAVAVRAGRRSGQAALLGNLGLVHWLQGDLAAAAEHHGRALALHRELGSRQNEAVNLANLGEAYHLLGRLEDADDQLTAALALHREVGDRGAEAETLRVLAAVQLDLGEHDRALVLATEAATLAAATGHLPVEANALNTLGTVRQRRGEPAAALADHERALRLARDTGTRYAELVALAALAQCQLRLGRPDRAYALAEHAVAGAERGGFRVVAADALTTLLDVRLSRGEPAVATGRRAIALHRATGHRYGEARTALLLGRALAAAGEHAAANRH